MRAVVQRVRQARVEVAGSCVGQIGPGMLILLGIHREDGSAEVRVLARRLLSLKIFEDASGAMNQSLEELPAAEVLCVSQFTLWGDTRKGRKPSWSRAAPAPRAEPLYLEFLEILREAGVGVASGIFGADMDVHLINHGPMTLVVES
ncbi:MAG: D-aminoacyl-tRNA deacylase [Candidatus Binatia bacterium]|nr:D-aminoacyl-tRNA deacylase [Candidatus Binatia bacterium]MDG1959943.1 D-aminoacyl-tRNA deacylase [Candidatus Binatia bacterium]MDG2009996.1 D-aminoacyl-tRNA deacylase [Candidatus Binatia bacterium]HAC80330.1 D-tyrosyl-tRNA(Tyr) deacylase [Deltaproteobacteria bacterium]